MRRLLALLGLALLTAAPGAMAAHQPYLPEGVMEVRVLFVRAGVPFLSPVPAADPVVQSTCQQTAGLPAGCTYFLPACTPQVLLVFCRLPP